MDDRRKKEGQAPPPPSFSPPPPPGKQSGQQPAHSGQQPADKPQHKKENVKETVESIIIAFILAFVFRAFVVEAFVIPTGSMAPTLLGAHMRFRCTDCGYQYDVNFSSSATRGDDINIPPKAGKGTTVSVHCPNCGDKLPEALANDPAVHYGDRILLLKYLYLIQEPKRWDVVVFKAPQKAGFAENYIKRLVGLKGETLMLLDGDIYACPNKDYDALTAEQRRDLNEIARLPWKVQAKPRYAQEAVWRIVYDNDFLPRNSEQRKKNGQKWHMPWQQESGSGWGDNPERILRFDNPAGEGTLTFDRHANPGTLPFTDWLAYDEHDQPSAQHWYVSDLKLQFSYERRSGDGKLRAELTKLAHRFIAEFEPNVARLIHVRPDGTRSQIGKDVALTDSGPLRVEFSNVDYRVTLRVNDRDIIQSGEGDFSPDISSLIDAFSAGSSEVRSSDDGGRFAPSARVSAEKQACDIAHLSLWRDIYYTPTLSGTPARGNPTEVVRLASRGDRDEEGHVLDNEFFVLGDNSSLSLDARAWGKSQGDEKHVDLRADEDLFAPPGRVPERFLLGKAFFVYWPAGYRPLTDSAPGVIPNFGEMRFIR